MQTKNPNPSGAADVQANGSGFGVIKSFTDLNGALITKEIDLFAEQVRKGIDNWRTAGKILVELSRRQPDIFRLIQARHPSISESTLQTFARIGRNEIWPPLLADSSLGARKLLECPYDVQKEFAEKPIQVAVSWRNGDVKTIPRRVNELSRAECAVVFDGDGGINTVEQQAWRLKKCGAEPVPEIRKPQFTNRLVNVDVGYFKLTLRDSAVTVEPCGKSPIAQPVRLVKTNEGQSALVIFYKQETR